MVRALLAGSKTQTRRVLRDQDPIDLGASMHGAHLSRRPVFDKVANKVIGHRMVPVLCPYGVPGDRLWVREAWGVGSRPCPREGGVDGLEYRADEAWLQEGDLLPLYRPELPDGVCLGDFHSGWRPSIHMFRWASRILLEITDVRVERLQAISEADAIAEGIEPRSGYWRDYSDANAGVVCSRPVNSYRTLWDSINGAASWDSNPWVWVVQFRVANT